jgi:DNA segregation ATPase FtsK/SpoIIIE, S-DNA-T family
VQSQRVQSQRVSRTVLLRPSGGSTSNGSAPTLPVAITADASVSLGRALTPEALGRLGGEQFANWRPNEFFAAVSLGQIRPGTTIEGTGESFAPQKFRAIHSSPAWVARVVAGSSVGRVHRLQLGRTVIGRSPHCDLRIDDPAVSAEHLSIHLDDDGQITVCDLNATNPALLDGQPLPSPSEAGLRLSEAQGSAASLISIGAAVVALSRDMSREQQRHETEAIPHQSVRFDDGTDAHHRPPRIPLPPAPAPLAIPAARPHAKGGVRLSPAAIVTPLIMGAVMAKLFSPVMAIMALMSPVMLLMNFGEDRRRKARERRTGERDLSVELSSFNNRLAAAAATERVRRLAADPSLGELLEWVRSGDSRLWERRGEHDDAYRCAIGHGDRRWPIAVVTGHAPAAAAAEDMLNAASTLCDVPIPVFMGATAVVGVTGRDRQAALSAARAMITRMAILHGPADLRIIVSTTADRVDAWEWTALLPHSQHPAGTGPLVVIGDTVPGDDDGAHIELVGTVGTQAHRLVIVDRAEPCPITSFVRDVTNRVSLLVVADHRSALPQTCSAALHLDADSSWTMTRYQQLSQTATIPTGRHQSQHRLGQYQDDDDTEEHHGVSIDTIDENTAQQCAASLHRLSDPFAAGSSANPPSVVHLRSAVPLTVSTEGIVAAWSERSRRRQRSLIGRLGMTATGPLDIDFVADGPHALIAGTTGSGKSELLRSLVLGLSLTHGPDEVTFVLIDYKGGAAFRGCEALPHTVGFVTDLDPSLSRRALICLEAELTYREELLRAHNVSDLIGYAQISGVAPLPRLMIVIDEFATMVKELPDFVKSLVGIAQRGRSLGMHLILATQRPSGALDENIRANTNIRIALRVTDTGDSSDVISSPIAASIPRRFAGRGYTRLGPGELVTFQAALSSAAPPQAHDGASVTRFGIAASLNEEPTQQRADGHDELASLIELCRAAGQHRNDPSPRRPWPEPLPNVVEPTGPNAEADDTGSDESGHSRCAMAGLVDEPHRQAVLPWTVDLQRGNIAVFGSTGSGTSSALRTLVGSLASSMSPEHLHVYGLDCGNQGLAPLAALPHTGAIVAIRDSERIERLLRLLVRQLDQRLELEPEAVDELPHIVFVIDGFSTLRSAFDDLAGQVLMDQLSRLVTEGHAVNITTFASADRSAGISFQVLSSFSERLVLKMSDSNELSSLGLRNVDQSGLGRGRAIEASSTLMVQLAHVKAHHLASTAQYWAERCPNPRRGATPIVSLPDVVELRSLLPVSDASVPATHSIGDLGPLRLVVGLADDLGAAAVTLLPGDSLLVAGPARSGKSSTLAVLARAARHAAGPIRILAVPGRRSPLPELLRPLSGIEMHESIATAWEDIEQSDATLPILLLVDDAELVTEAPKGFVTALTERRMNLTVMAAGRPDALRSSFGHWTTHVRRSRTGIALRPALDMDGELWATSLPRRTTRRFPTGRGFLVADGGYTLVQIGALPEESAPDARTPSSEKALRPPVTQLTP